MRDGSTSYETGWLSDGDYLDPRLDLSRALAGLGDEGAAEAVANMNPAGRKYVLNAARDPQARPAVIALLRSSNPHAAFADQAAKDIAEALNPSGKPIVLKSLVAKVAPRLQAAQNRVAAAADPHSVEGRVVRHIIQTSEDPKADVREYLTQVAFEAVAPGISDQEGEEFLSGLGNLGMSKKWRKIAKTAAIVAAVGVGAAVTGGVILPAIAPAIGSVASAVVGGVGSLFASKATAAQKLPSGADVPTGVDQGYVQTEVRAIFDAQQRGDMASFNSRSQNLVAYLGRYGVSSQDAIQYINNSLIALKGGAAPAATAPADAGGGADLSKVADIALQIFRLRQSGNVAAANQLNQQAVGMLQQQGMSEGTAAALVSQALAQTEQQYAPAMPAGGAPVILPPPGAMPPAPQEASTFRGGDILKYGLIAAAGLAVVSQLGRGRGGARRSSRRR